MPDSNFLTWRTCAAWLIGDAVDNVGTLADIGVRTVLTRYGQAVGNMVLLESLPVHGVELADRLRPDVVLLEPHLLDGDGLGVCRRLRAVAGGPRVLLYHGDPDPALGILARMKKRKEREKK